MREVIARGGQPSSQLAAWPCYPPDFVALYRTGEATGQLERNLLLLSEQYQEKANRALTLVTMAYPAVVFLAVAAVVAFNVIKMYAGYFKMLDRVGS